MEETSVSEKIDADLCPICLDVFFSTQDFLQHVQETYHISSKSNCSKTIKSCESDNMCPLCQDSVFGEPVNLLKHMFEKHSVSSKETCQICLQDCIKTECDETVSNVKIENCETKIKSENDNFSEITSFIESCEWETNDIVKFEDSPKQAKIEDCNPAYNPFKLANKNIKRYETTQTMQISETQSNEQLKIQKNPDLSHKKSEYYSNLLKFSLKSRTKSPKMSKSMENDDVHSEDEKLAALEKLQQQNHKREKKQLNIKSIIEDERKMKLIRAATLRDFRKATNKWMLNAVGPSEMDILNQRAEEEALKRTYTNQVSNIKYDKFGFVMAQVQHQQPIISATKKDLDQDCDKKRDHDQQRQTNK
mgnify:FL=1